MYNFATKDYKLNSIKNESSEYRTRDFLIIEAPLQMIRIILNVPKETNLRKSENMHREHSYGDGDTSFSDHKINTLLKRIKPNQNPQLLWTLNVTH